MLDSCPALVLNADFRPLSYFPLSLWCWQDAVKAVFLDRVNIIDHYDTYVRSPSFEMQLPSVIALKEYVHAAPHPAFTRFNLFPLHPPVLQPAASVARFDLRPCGATLARRPDGMGQRRHRLRQLQPPEGQPAAAAERNVSAAAPGAADHLHAAGKRARLPAQLPARELARLSLLGYRARPGVKHPPRQRRIARRRRDRFGLERDAAGDRRRAETGAGRRARAQLFRSVARRLLALLSRCGDLLSDVLGPARAPGHERAMGRRRDSPDRRGRDHRLCDLLDRLSADHAVALPRDRPREPVSSFHGRVQLVPGAADRAVSDR